MKNRLFIPFLIFLFSLLIFVPIILQPDIFLSRGNDLTEFFWPIYYFTKEHLVRDHALPFWNNLFLSGTPLLPDPQAPIFYLPNIIFLFLPIGTAFLVSAFLHTFLGGIFAYLAASRGFKLTKSASLVASFLYVASPRLTGYLEAGHFGLICAYMWLPLVVLSVTLMARKPSVYSSILLALSLSGLFYTHTTTFVISSFISGLLLLALPKKNKFSSLKFFVFGAILTFGLTAVALLPQLGWVPETNRYLLSSDKNVSPIWLSKFEFLKSMLAPWINGLPGAQNLETEKGVTLGLLPTALVIVGFFKLKNFYKLILLVSVLAITLIALNNSSPIYSFLLTQNWFVFARVSTRIWFIMVLIFAFLGAYGFQIIAGNRKFFGILFASLAILEVLIISFLKITKPISVDNHFAPKEVYEFLKRDNDRFRVFCTTRCLSQKTSAEYGLELIDGYSTLIQKNYNSHVWQMMGTYWSYYTLTIPPIGSYINHEVRPDAVSLGEYNTKYIISPYPLSDKNFVEVKKITDYLIYLNKAYQPRSPAPITYYSPNRIIVDTSNYKDKSLTLSEVYSSGWKAYIDGKRETPVQETPVSLRLIETGSNPRFIDLRYDPPGFNVGKYLTLVTLTLILFLGLNIFKNQQNNSD